ncbi:hypothetical protein PLESTF_001000700, partial [Pleodorina starrii]
MQAVLGAIPADWRRLLPADPLDPELPPAPDWLLSPDGSRDHQRYSEAPPAQRASSWPVEYQLLGLWDSVQCYPLSHGHGTLPLIHYTVSEVRHRLTARGHSWGRDQDTEPLMPAAWPEQPHSQLQQQEARWHQHWLAQQAPSRSRWFAMNPTPSPGWMRPRSSPPSLPSAAASPVSQPSSRHAAPHQQDPGAAAGPSAPAGPAPEADPAADGPAGMSPLDRRRAFFFFF